MESLRDGLSRTTPVCAPLVLNPLMAKMAEASGFEAMAASYKELSKDFMDDSRPLEAWYELEGKLHDTIEIKKLLSIEKVTVEKE